MTDAHGVARDQLRSFISRIERLEEEKKTIADDIKDVYGEAKAMGFDTVILKRVVTLRKKDDQKRMEEEMVLATYLAALGMIPEPFEPEEDPETNSPASDDSPIVPPLAGSARAEGSAASNYSRPATQAVSGGEPSIPSSDEGSAKTGTGSNALPGRSDETSARKVAKSEQATNTISTADQPLTGGDHVDAEPATMAGSLVQPLPATPGAITWEDFPPAPMKRTAFAHCFPELSKAQYDALFVAIDNAYSIEEPIVRKGDVILDGWARYNIARALGIQYPVMEYDGEDELLDVIAWQRSSREWSAAQERKIAVALAKEIPHRADEIMAAFEIEMEAA